MLTALKDVLESPAALGEEVLGFPEYLDLVKREPWITRNTFQLLHDMLVSSGVECTIVAGKPITFDQVVERVRKGKKTFRLE